MKKIISTKTLREVQGILANHPLSQKHSVDEIVKLARRKKVARLYKNEENKRLEP